MLGGTWANTIFMLEQVRSADRLPDYITMLVVRVSTLLIIGIPCAQAQCEINPTRGNPFHYELANTNPLHVRKFRER